MRMICPNCDAHYEVDPALIPATGRDVQCSDCGHVWFQPGAVPEVDASADDSSALPEPAPPEPEVATEPPPPPDPEDEPGVTPLAQRSLDDKLLAVLKEEAERETRAREAERQTRVETQPDLGLDAAPPRRVAVRPRPAPDTVEDIPEPPAPRSTRKELLPDIEQINSTLSPSGANRGPSDGSGQDMRLPATPRRRRRAFRNSFLLVLLVALVGVIVYVQAKTISDAIPQISGPIEAYVTQVNGWRLRLDVWLADFLARIQAASGT